MVIPETILNQLFQNMSEYNPTTNDAMTKIAKVLMPLGMSIVGVLFLLELQNYSRQFDKEDGGLTVEAVLNISMKYIIAYVAIMGSGYIIDGIVWFGIQIAKWINSIVTITGTSDAIPSMEKNSFWQKPIVFLFEIFAYISLWLATAIGVILIFLRSIQLYIVKAMAPILIAFCASEELKPIAVGYMKQIMAFVLQGALLILIIGLIPIITANDYLSFATFEGGIWQGAGAVVVNIMIYVSLIAKYITIIILLVGSQGMAKRFVGAM